jgi:hypothetical protein
VATALLPPSLTEHDGLALALEEHSAVVGNLVALTYLEILPLSSGDVLGVGVEIKERDLTFFFVVNGARGVLEDKVTLAATDEALLLTLFPAAGCGMGTTLRFNPGPAFGGRPFLWDVSECAAAERAAKVARLRCSLLTPLSSTRSACR